MKKLITILLLFIGINSFSQNTVWHLGKIGMKYANPTVNDSLLITFNGDSTLYYSHSNPFHKFAQPIIVDSIKLNGVWGKRFGIWDKIGGDANYPNGNVFIGKTSGTYKLDVNGFIGGSNIETDLINNVRLGLNTLGSVTSGNSNIAIGSSAGAAIENGRYNILIGEGAGGENVNGNQNICIGISAGTGGGVSNINIGTFAGIFNHGLGNVIVGESSGYSLYSSNYNTFIGYKAGWANQGSGNIIIGHKANYLGRFVDNELVIDNQERGTTEADSLLYRNNSLIYGVFDATPANQTLDVNAKLYYAGTFAEIYKSGANVAQAIATGATPVKITAFTDNGYSNNCTPDATNDKITITKKGYYDLTLDISYESGTTNVTWVAHIFKGGTVVNNIHSTGNTATSNLPRSTSLGGLLYVDTVPVDIDYRVTHDNGGSVNISFNYANLRVKYIGE